MISRTRIKLSLIFLLALPSISIPQTNNILKLQGKILGEFRSNITRQPDSLRLSDYRTKFFFNSSKQFPFLANGKLKIFYELYHYRYADFKEFSLYDQKFRGVLQKNLGTGIKLAASEEFRVRLYPSAVGLNYQRNIFDIFIFKRVPILDNITLGYQNWLKLYPRNNLLQRYKSHRVFIKISPGGNWARNIAARFEFQNHRGNLYPGSTAPAQLLNMNGNRYILNLMFDRILNPKLITSFGYRIEIDQANGFEIQQSGEHFDDENSEEIFADDSDFGYVKNQVSFSMLFKMNSRISVLTFYLLYDKGFKYWQVSQNGPKRHDRLLFLSHILKIKIIKSLGFELHYIFEGNYTNLEFYKYKINSVSFGLFLRP